jgi:hypothetical protein
MKRLALSLLMILVISENEIAPIAFAEVERIDEGKVDQHCKEGWVTKCWQQYCEQSEIDTTREEILNSKGEWIEQPRIISPVVCHWKCGCVYPLGRQIEKIEK